jgi:hypothetical protein
MGIDVWRQRGSRADVADPSPSSAKPIEGVRPSPVHPESGHAATRIRVPARVRASEREPPATHPAEEPDAYTVLCLSNAGNEGAVVIAAPRDLRTGRRFAADLLASVTGVWGGELRQILFDWPQPGLDGSRTAAAKALGAFVDKQVADLGDGTVLIGAEVVERLGSRELPEHWLVTPRFDELMTSGEAKRALWRELARHASS